MKFKIPPDKRFLTAQVVFAIIVTICLSYWQLGRGLEKLNEKHVFEARLKEPPISASQWQAEDSVFRHIELRGQLDPQRMFLVEGRRHLGQSGYWVVGVFNTEQGRFLVNRGWTPLSGNVQVKPQPHTPIDTILVHGVLWPRAEQGTSRTNVQPRVEWPILIRDLDVDVMAARTGAYAQEIRLVDGSPGTLVAPAPLVMTFATAIHWGYAVQWLVIGTLIGAGYWYFVLRPKEDQ